MGNISGSRPSLSVHGAHEGNPVEPFQVARRLVVGPREKSYTERSVPEEIQIEFTRLEWCASSCLRSHMSRMMCEMSLIKRRCGAHHEITSESGSHSGNIVFPQKSEMLGSKCL